MSSEQGDPIKTLIRAPLQNKLQSVKMPCLKQKLLQTLSVPCLKGRLVIRAALSLRPFARVFNSLLDALPVV